MRFQRERGAMRRRIEIVAFERERILSHSVVTHCPVCRSHSELLTLDQAAALAQVEVRSILDWLAGGKMHGPTTPNGQQRVCKNSLLRFAV
jgi:hypothetical protein